MTRKIEVARALQDIGTKIVPPLASQDPMDALLHEYDVASIIASIADKRKKEALSAIQAKLSDKQRADIDKLVADTEELGVGSAKNIIDAQNNGLDVLTKNGASYLDTDTLKKLLIARLGRDEADDVIRNATKRRAPSKLYSVIEYEDR